MEDTTTHCPSLTLEGWYGQQTYTLEWVSQTAVWYHTGLPPVPIRWVLVRDPLSKFEHQAFLCTDLEATPAQILLGFRQRWHVEVTFQEVRAHLGVETQRQWSDLAILRTTPALLALFSLVVLLTQRLPAILILAKSYSKARNKGRVMPSERPKRARAVERTRFV